MADIDLRQATLNDADSIRRLVRDAYARWVPVIGREPLPMRVDYAEALSRHRIDLLHVDDALAGVIETLVHADHLWIENVAVHPDWQGRAYGRLLLGYAESLARAADVAQVRLLTNAAFAANVTLYEKVGYSTDRTEPFMGGTTLYMSKSLP